MTAFSPAPIKTMTVLRPAVAVALCVLLLDQAVKALIVRAIGPEAERHAVWLSGRWLGLEYVQNRGVAFGITLGSSALTVAVSIVAFAVIGALFWRMAGGGRLAVATLGLLAGGALGNLVDRARLGHVVDFVAVGPWPRFNVADSAITIGMLGLAWAALRADLAHHAEEPAQDEGQVHA